MNSSESSGPLVTTKWLYNNINYPNLIILDASMATPAKKNSEPTALTASQILGAQFFDFDKKIVDKNSTLPHMMPPASLFEAEVQALGIHSDSLIVCYDRIGVYSSPRARWMFKAMGHKEVYILDGGLPAWMDLNYPTETHRENKRSQGTFTANPVQNLFCTANEVADAIDTQETIILDARSEGRFFGRELEPRAGLRSGHIPSSLNLPFDGVLKNGYYKDKNELVNIFNSRLNHLNKKLIFSCGSGVTACIISTAAELAGYTNLSVYDGSWSEWGLPSDRSVSIS